MALERLEGNGSPDEKQPGEFVDGGRRGFRYYNDEGVLVETFWMGGPPGPLPPRYQGRFGLWRRRWDHFLWFFVPGPLKIWLNDRWEAAEKASEREQEERVSAKDLD